MKRSVLILIVLPFHTLVGHVSTATCAAGRLIDDFASFCDKIVPFRLAEPVEVVRRDLLLGEMPKQAALTKRVTRVERDQRPLIEMFRLPRNDFAF